MDPYKVLGVDQNADLQTIKSAFRKRAKETHPDLNPNNPHAAEEFREVVDAYSIILNKDKKAEYNTVTDSNASYTETETEWYNNAATEANAYNTTSSEGDFSYQDYYYNMYSQMANMASDAVDSLFEGLLTLVVGICFTLGGYLYAYMHGGVYRIMYGLIAIGALGMITGLYRYIKIKHSIKEFEKEFMEGM